MDVINLWGDLSRYRLIIMPAYNLMSQEETEILKNFVSQGGTLILTFRSGTRDKSNVMTDQTFPGCLKELAGIEIHDFNALSPEETTGIMVKGTPVKSSQWNDIITLKTARSLGEYTEMFYTGKPGVTVNSFGKGTVYYVGCDLDERGMEELASISLGGIQFSRHLPAMPEGVELIVREKNNKTYFMIMNHNDFEVNLELGGDYQDLLKEKSFTSEDSLEPFGTLILTS